MHHLSSCVFAIVAAAIPLTAQGEDPAAKKKPDPEVAAKLDTFDDAIKDKDFALDTKAIEIIDELTQKWADLHAKDQGAFLKALDSVFKVRKRTPEQPGLYKSTVFALGTVGGDKASEALVKVYDKKPFDEDEWLNMRADILENIGRTKADKQIDFLVDRATKDPVDPIKAAAGKALRHFAGTDSDVRKDIVKRLLRDYAKIEGDSQSLDGNSAVAATRKRTLAAIADPWNTALKELTGQDIKTAEEWQHWYNKNKDKKWE